MSTPKPGSVGRRAAGATTQGYRPHDQAPQRKGARSPLMTDRRGVGWNPPPAALRELCSVLGSPAGRGQPRRAAPNAITRRAACLPVPTLLRPEALGNSAAGTVATRRRKPPGATTRGGWAMHTNAVAPLSPPRQRRQSHLLPLPRTHPLHAGEDWHLDHDDSRGGYLGVRTRAATSPRARPRRTATVNTPPSSSPTAGVSVGTTTRPSAPSSSATNASSTWENGDWQPLED